MNAKATMNANALSERDALEKARRIHAEHIVIDSLSPSITAEWVMTPPMVELAKKLQAEGRKRSGIQAALTEYLVDHCVSDPATREAYLAYWARSGVTACHNTVYAFGAPEEAWNSAITEFGRTARLVNALQGALVVAGSAADVEQAHKQGKRAVIYNMQSAEPIGDRFERVDTLHDLGLRSTQLTYNLRTRFGDGCLERNDGGLSRFGLALVEKLNASRVMVDCSHGSPKTAMDIATVSRRPVIASHTAARALTGHARGLPDDVLKAIAKTGGYIGVVMLPAFIVPAGGDGRAEKLGKPAGWATPDTVVDHVMHILNLVGEDHVGIGTDWGKPYYSAITWSSAMVNEAKSGFDWVGWRPEDRFDPNMQVCGVETWDNWHQLTAALLRRGLSEATVAKVVGGNFLRVFRDVCG